MLVRIIDVPKERGVKDAWSTITVIIAIMIIMVPEERGPEDAEGEEEAHGEAEEEGGGEAVGEDHDVVVGGEALLLEDGARLLEDGGARGGRDGDEDGEEKRQSEQGDVQRLLEVEGMRSAGELQRGVRRDLHIERVRTLWSYLSGLDINQQNILIGFL